MVAQFAQQSASATTSRRYIPILSRSSKISPTMPTAPSPTYVKTSSPLKKRSLRTLPVLTRPLRLMLHISAILRQHISNPVNILLGPWSSKPSSPLDSRLWSSVQLVCSHPNHPVSVTTLSRRRLWKPRVRSLRLLATFKRKFCPMTKSQRYLLLRLKRQSPLQSSNGTTTLPSHIVISPSISQLLSYNNTTTPASR